MTHPHSATTAEHTNPRNASGVRFDARASLVMVLAFSVSLFFVGTWAGMAVFAAVLAAVLIAARVNLRSLAKCLAPLCFILAFTALAHIPQGLGEGLFYALRILLLALATLAVAFSYDNTQLVRAFSAFLSPLRALHAPVDDIASMFSIALRFIPASMEEFQRIAKAQRSRAAKLDEGGMVERIRHWSSVLVPMLVSLFRRAGVLAQGMEARCYGCAAKRTSLHGNGRIRPVEAAFALMASSLCILAGILL